MRLIDADELFKCNVKGTFSECDTCIHDELCTLINEATTIEAIPKSVYEARLKADMVAMLTEIQLEIKENIKIEYNELDEIQGAIRAGRIMENGDCSRIIQQKINELKEQTNEQ